MAKTLFASAATCAALLVASAQPAVSSDREVIVDQGRTESSARLQVNDRQSPFVDPGQARKSNDSSPTRSSRGFIPDPYFVTNCTNYSDGRIECPEADSAEAAEPPAEQLTPGRIERAIREIEMPRLALRVQPGGRTLVNVPTILSTTPADVDRTITLLGSSIDVQARPTSYTWHHGDGTTQTTAGPGAPWPVKDVTHTYRRSAERVSLRLDVAYTVRYRVDGGAWTPLDQALTTSSAPVALRVDQAAPVLTRP